MFLADENVPPKVIEFLRSKGCKVKDVREDNLQGISDNELIHMAENKDEEFNKWSCGIAKSQAGKGQPVVYIRIKKMRPIRSRIDELEIAVRG